MTKTTIINIDPKYDVAWENQAAFIVSKGSGNTIPADEPLILFRARDRHALSALQAYLSACEQGGCTPAHMSGINERIRAFESFRNNNPIRMKQPGLRVEVK